VGEAFGLLGAEVVGLGPVGVGVQLPDVVVESALQGDAAQASLGALLAERR
jgi:hypothetical protein